MKKAVIFFILALLILPLASCTNRPSLSNESNKGNLIGAGSRRPDFGQPDDPADIRGLITGLIGNEAAILKLSQPQYGERDIDNDPAFAREGEGSGRENGNNNVLGLGNTGIRGPGGGFRGTRPEIDDGAREQILERMKSMAEGEEKVLIPVGIRMLKPDSSEAGSKPNMVEATLEDVEVDSMVQIWLDDSVTDRKVAEFVLILN